MRPVVLAFGSSIAVLAAILLHVLVSALKGGRLSRAVEGNRGRLREMLLRVEPRLARFRPLARVASAVDLRGRVIAAGEPGGLGAREWLSAKAAVAVGALILAIPIGASSPGRLGILVIAAAPAAGFMLPDFWLSRAARLRSEAALRELPDMVDLLRVAIEGGQSPTRAMAAVASRFDGPLADEWHRVAASVQLGYPLEPSLEAMRDRLDANPVAALAEALRSASHHGSNLADSLQMLAVSTRHAHAQRVRERAARAGPKIQLVVALVLVPSALLVVAAGILSELAGGGIGV